MDQMLYCCIEVFEYVSIICQSGGSANDFEVRRIAQLTVFMSLALTNGRLLYIYRSRSLPVGNTRRAMSERLNRWVLRLLETIDPGVVYACGCNFHCLCLRYILVAWMQSAFLMIVRASGLGMGVCRITTTLRGVGVIAMPNARQDTT
jgi:hypothetical protein